ncbi:MAG: hypothetical protein WCJ19_00025 [bacterium]
MKSNLNKKISNLLVSAVVIFFTAADIVQAKCGIVADPLDPNCTGTPSLGDLVGGFIPFIPIAVGVLLFGMITVGAVQITIAGPNDEAKKKGIQTIQNAIVGAVILFVSVGIVSLIEAIFGVKLLYGVNIGK